MSISCKRFGRLLAWPAAALLLGGVAGAQEPVPATVPGPAPAQVPPPVPTPSSAGSVVAPVPPPANAVKPTRVQSSAQSEAGEPRATTGLPSPATPSPASASRAPSATPKSGAADRLDLNTATVTGDREQPKVMYIVPWKRADIGDLSGKPTNSLLDEALAPVDRDEFKREVTYYDAMSKDASHNGASKP